MKKMKINITIEPYIIGDYKNISAVDNIYEIPASIADVAECKEIIAEELIDYIPVDNMLEVITHYVSKLRLGGKIVLGGTDIIELSKDILHQNKTMIEANHEVFGDPRFPKRGFLALNDVAAILSHLGLKITKQRLDGSKFIIEAIRE